MLQVLSEEDAKLKVEISTGQNAGFQFKSHPNIDKGLYTSENVLRLRDPQKPFPVGSPLGILKWRMQVGFGMQTRFLCSLFSIEVQ